MLLDKLLSHMVVHVEPFATCLLSGGWRLGLPGPPDAMFHFALQGSGVVRGPAGEKYRLERYSLAVVPKGVQHALECGPEIRSERLIESSPSGDGVVQLIAGPMETVELRVACGVVRASYGDSLGLFQRMREIIVADLSGYPQVRAAFETILEEQGGTSPGSIMLTRSLMSQCLVYLLRQLGERSDGRLPWLSGLEDPDLGRVLDLMLERPAAPHTVDSLAQIAHMSRSLFAERFKAAFGDSPIAILHDIRMRRAADLLRQRPETSIEQLARDVGFSSRSHFSAAFKEYFGASPVALRHR